MAPRKSTPNRREGQTRLRRRDYSGQRYGRLVAVRFSRIASKKTFWVFLCDCGREFECRIDQARSGNTRSCGCLLSDVAAGRKPSRQGARRAVEDLAGQRFGRLTVLGEAEKKPNISHRRWLCRCDCGKDITTEHGRLKSGKTRSCGCIQREKAAEQAVAMGAGNKTHGMSDSAEWLAWKNMISRCEDPGQESWPHYGGRGIRVCERWRDSFEAFFADMGLRPSDRHSVGRIDNDGDYEPDNCEWQTHTQQNRNRRSTTFCTFNGETKCLTEWAEQAGMTRTDLWRRLKYGWPFELAITTPLGQTPPGLKELRGEVDPLRRLRAHAKAAMHQAIKRGEVARAGKCEHPGCDEARVFSYHHKGLEREHWLDVLWLCRTHHRQALRQEKRP